VKTLIIDTALGACTAVAADGSRVVAAESEVMARGHQERLGGMARGAMAAAGWSFDQLDRIAVTTGPGSFTGLRVGLAFAQGRHSHGQFLREGLLGRVFKGQGHGHHVTAFERGLQLHQQEQYNHPPCEGYVPPLHQSRRVQVCQRC